MILPPALNLGDTIAICSPAGAVKPELFAPAIEALTSRGYRVKVMPHAMGRYGSYSADADARLGDMLSALHDPDVKAIMCGRGGYGAVELLHRLEEYVTADNPKWLIGFSDITALHALWQTKGIASVHASMLKGLAEGPLALTDRLFDILEGRKVVYDWGVTHSLNRPGMAKGQLCGGNLSVLGALIGTPYTDYLKGANRILIIEDVNEPIYKIERILWQLRYAGILPSLSGLIVGDFTGTKADLNYSDAYAMVYAMVSEYSFPVALGVPVGHIADNHPLLLGHCTLMVDANGSVSVRS